MKKKITSIWYRYDDMTIDYVDSVKELSTTSIFNFLWINEIYTKIKSYLR